MFPATLSSPITWSCWKVRRIPQRARRCADIASRSSPKQDTVPETGVTKPLRTLKKVVLPAPFGPISPHVPRSKLRATAFSGRTPPKRTVTASTSSTCSLSQGERSERHRTVFHLTGHAGRCCRKHLNDADSEEDEDDVAGEVQGVEEGRHELQERPGQHRAEKAVSATHQNRGEEHDGLPRADCAPVERADAGDVEGTRNSTPEARKCERPQPVESDVDAATERRSLTLADRRPGTARTCPQVKKRKQKDDRGDDDGVAEEGGVALRHCRTPHRRACLKTAYEAERPGAAIGKASCLKDDLEGASGHECHKSEIETRHAQRRDPDKDTDEGRYGSGDDKQHREGKGRPQAEAEADPAAYANERHLAERDHADAPIEEAATAGGDRGDHGRDARLEPEGVRDRRDDEQYEEAEDACEELSAKARRESTRPREECSRREGAGLHACAHRR